MRLTESRDLGDDLDGDRTVDNQIGAVAGALAQQNDLTTHGGDMIAWCAGASRSTPTFRKTIPASASRCSGATATRPPWRSAAGPQDTCFDRIRGNESDVDCGDRCLPCAGSLACSNEGDCQSRACTSGTCAAVSCTDGVLDGLESDVDCGGWECAGCSSGHNCASADCASGACTLDRCE